MQAVGVSVDVDSVASHLRGYGIANCADSSSVYEIALPRALELFAREKIRATFFFVAEEAQRFPTFVRRVSEAGHEIASHSMTHRLPFCLIDPEVCKLELECSRSVLEKISGAKVVGFRAPSYDVSPQLFEQLRKAGYLYDASLFPSWMLALLRGRVRALSAETGSREPSALKPSAPQSRGVLAFDQFFATAVPHAIDLADNIQVDRPALVEIPLSTVPILRLPFYHTLAYMLPRWTFMLLGRAALARNSPLSYLLHGADFLSVAEDSLDVRFGRHPGMTLPIESKLRLVAEVLHAITEGRRSVPLCEIAAECS